ncbi:uncharacterized protein LOC128125988 [Lactuca sativa]|uniref:uncharacterized protein LOC128125988 n=1 Tax=Lactuca sativa TaxID=4236 RepID=UPI000CD87CFE|nr:uncharacterized protein LOC128125988 [Lactuca sativa]
MWEKGSKVNDRPRLSFTVEGFDFNDVGIDDFEGAANEDGDIHGSTPTTPDTHLSPVNVDWTNSETQPNYHSDSQTGPQRNQSNNPIPLSPPITPNSSNSPSSASSSTGGGAPKRYRLLTDLYENTEEIQLPPEELMLLSSDDEPASYSEACRKKEWIQAMNDEIASIEKKTTPGA